MSRHTTLKAPALSLGATSPGGSSVAGASPRGPALSAVELLAAAASTWSSSGGSPFSLASASSNSKSPLVLSFQNGHHHHHYDGGNHIGGSEASSSSSSNPISRLLAPGAFRDLAHRYERATMHARGQAQSMQELLSLEHLTTHSSPEALIQRLMAGLDPSLVADALANSRHVVDAPLYLNECTTSLDVPVAFRRHSRAARPTALEHEPFVSDASYDAFCRSVRDDPTTPILITDDHYQEILARHKLKRKRIEFEDGERLTRAPKKRRRIANVSSNAFIYPDTTPGEATNAYIAATDTNPSTKLPLSRIIFHEDGRPMRRKRLDEDGGRKVSAAIEKLYKQEDTTRKKLWQSAIKNELPKVHRAVLYRATLASKKYEAARKALLKEIERKKRPTRTVKDTNEFALRAKKMCREMQAYWRKYDKEERERLRAEQKAATERRKLDEEIREAKRQQMKLNFLLTQTELFAHFVAKKIGVETEGEGAADGDAAATASSSTTTTTTALDANSSAEDAEELRRMREQAKEASSSVIAQINAETKAFDDDIQHMRQVNLQRRQAHAHAHGHHGASALDTTPPRPAAPQGLPTPVTPMTLSFGTSSMDTSTSPRPVVPSAAAGGAMPTDAALLALDSLNTSGLAQGAEMLENVAQPSMFRGSLKPYQIKGLNWLVNLYDQGINGILADEMGLGKTIQSIAFLSHLAEEKNIWGPFLIISPTSTLHNWQREVTRFAPMLKVLPYWGTQSDRKIIRKYWNPKYLYTKDAPFHVLVTSYNIVILDEKYFKRLKWQYMVLDEAQAVKSASSVRWKTLLGFNCRNRLLLTGTPIQNNMAELWALLHFIMPKFFDSHEEFNEWFSRGIESTVTGDQKLGGISEQQIHRLHMILKPFMMRRVKKDVENELAEKIEINLSCHLTERQKRFYTGIRNKISIADLMDKASMSEQVMGRLMNLVVQFRKVCNHPDLFERRETASPFLFLDPQQASVDENPIVLKLPRFLYQNDPIRKTNLLYSTLFIMTPEYIHRSSQGASSAFSFLRFCNMTASEFAKFARSDELRQFLFHEEMQERAVTMAVRDEMADGDYTGIRPSLLVVPTQQARRSFSPAYKDIVRPDVFERDYIRVVKSTYFETPKVHAFPISIYCPDRRFTFQAAHQRRQPDIIKVLLGNAGAPRLTVEEEQELDRKGVLGNNGLLGRLYDVIGVSYITVPNLDQLLRDSGKLRALDTLLTELKAGGHRALVYCQMTKMIDILEEYMAFRGHRYIRLDGSSKLEDRRDMVEDWQTQPELFVFLLSTRAGGLGINLTAADTVIFYDSDWNPTMDAQAMDRAHRLGQTKQVTVYRLVTLSTIEERILQRAKEKHDIQSLVIAGGKFKPDQVRQQEVVSLLLDDAEVEENLHRKKEQQKRKGVRGASSTVSVADEPIDKLDEYF